MGLAGLSDAPRGWAAPAAAGVAGLALGALLALWASRPADASAGTRISFAACGVAAAPGLEALPVGAFRSGAGLLPFSVGPVRLWPGGPPLTLRFAETPDASSKRALRSADAVVLPLLAGRDAPAPDEITLRCRYDRLAAALYRYGDTLVVVPAIDAEEAADVGAAPPAPITSPRAGG